MDAAESGVINELHAFFCDGFLHAVKDDRGWRVYVNNGPGRPQTYVDVDGGEVVGHILSAPRFGSLEEAKTAATKWALKGDS